MNKSVKQCFTNHLKKALKGIPLVDVAIAGLGKIVEALQIGSVHHLVTKIETALAGMKE